MIPATNAAQDEGTSPSLSSLPSVEINLPAPPPPSPPGDSTPASPSCPTSSSHLSCPPVAAAPESENPQSEIPNPQSDIPLLTQEERRQILARLARVNPLDCFDASGAFDLARARDVLPPGSIRRITVHETTQPNAQGQSITERRIDVSLFNPVAALRLDEQMERRRERDASNSSSPSPPESDSDPDSPPPAPHTPEYGPYLLRLKTRGLEEANRTLAILKKTLAEKKDRQRRLFQALDEKDHPRSTREAGVATPLSGESKTLSSSSTALQSRDQSSQGDTGCQPVQESLQTSTDSQHEPEPQSSAALQSRAHSALTHAPAQNAPNKSQGSQPPRKSSDEIPYHELPRRKLEIEDMRSTSSPTVFAAWLKATAIEPPGFRTGVPRPPPEYGPLSMMSQGRCKMVE